MILGQGHPRYGVCFEELDTALRALTDRTVVLNAHNFTPPSGSIVYNLENFNVLRAPTRWAAHEVWDFSARNVGRYPGAMQVKHVPLGYHPSMQRFEMLPWAKRDIDVIFFGTPHPRRSHIFKALERHKLRVVHHVIAHGKARDGLLSRAKLAINLQYYADGVYPTLRTMHCVANGLPVVSEIAPEIPDWALNLPHVSYDKLVSTIVKIFRDGEPLDVEPARQALIETPLVLPEAAPAKRTPLTLTVPIRLEPSSTSGQVPHINGKPVRAPQVPGPLVLSANYRGFDSKKALPWGGLCYDETRRDNAHLTGHYLRATPKCAPHLLGHDDDDILWIDGSMRPTGRELGSLFDQVPPGGLGVFRHRWRNCIQQEWVAASRMPRTFGQPIREQALHYSKMGHPDGWGLWETGIIVWRGAQKIIGESWLAQQMAWSCCDQLSFPFVLRQHGIVPTDLRSGNVVDNPWFRYEEHQKTGVTRKAASRSTRSTSSSRHRHR